MSALLEGLEARIEVQARRRATEVANRLADRLEEELPAGIGVDVSSRGVEFRGRGIRRRFALDPALRWLVAGLVGNGRGRAG